MELLIATSNKFKIDEMEWFVKDYPGVNIHSLNELKSLPDIKEDGDTLEQNAIKKAVEISKITPHNWYVFTSDVGVALPGLKNKWDYRRPRRNLGEHSTEAEKVKNLMKLMKGLKGEDRKALYPLALAIAKNGKLFWSKEFYAYEGYIVEAPDYKDIRENRGMGRMWYLPQFKNTEDRLSDDERELLRQIQTPVKIELWKNLALLN